MRKQSRTRAVLAVVLAALVLGVTIVHAEYDGSDPAATDVQPDVAMLNGQVVVGPACPGPTRVTQPPQCQDQPYAATLSIQTPDGTQEVTQVTTDPQGQFSVQLDPGTFHIVPLTPSGSILPRGIPQDVTLAPGETLNITVQYDSGIR